MDLNNPVIQLCIKGSQAEYEGRRADAALLYNQAWEESTDDYDACIAAHYVARTQEILQTILHWNLEALKHAEAVHDERVIDFFPSFYVNLGHSYELLGNQNEAK